MSDLAKALRDHNTKANRLVERAIVAENIADDLEASLKPLGYFNIPELLDKRRLEFGIPNGAFESYPLYDKVYIHQIPIRQRKTYAADGAIIMPDAVVSHDRNTAARGIIISAGLQALDSLRSTGVDLGHIIRFKKFAPFIQEVEEIKGVALCVMTLRDGDCVASEDLAREIHERKISVVNVAEDKLGFDHRFQKQLPNGEVALTGKKVAAYYDPSV